MYKVIGLGKLGCAIAEELTTYPEYRVYKIDTQIDERASLSLERQLSMDLYEKNIDLNEIDIYLRSIKDNDEVLLVLEGGDPLCGAALKILERIKRTEISVMYVCPEREMLSDIQKRDDKISFSVLQEYARSGTFEHIYLVHAPVVEVLMGETSIREYEKQFSYFVSYIFAMINYFSHSSPVASNKITPPAGCRIISLGATLLENENPPLNLLFPLQAINDIHFFYGIPEGEITEDTALLNRIKSHVRFYKSENVSTSYSIYSLQTDKKISLCAAYSHDIQRLPSS